MDIHQMISLSKGLVPQAHINCSRLHRHASIASLSRDLDCSPRERKKRKVAETQEELQEKARQKDIQIEELLQQLSNMKMRAKFMQWKTSSNAMGQQVSGDAFAIHNKWSQTGPEEAAIMYFKGFQIGKTSVPAIVKECRLYPEDIEELFRIYFRWINPYFSILDEDYHKPERLIWSSPFLFIVVCAISARHLASRPDVYPHALLFAREVAGISLIEGQKSVETCQAYLLMAVYPIPKKTWSEDKSWLLMGLAIRMALALDLHQPPPLLCSEQDQLNRVRTWLNCYCVDGSHAIQFGKMSMLQLEDYHARSAADWYKSSQKNTPFDVHLCAYVRILAVMSEWRTATSPHSAAERKTTNSSESSRLVELAISTQARIAEEMDQWKLVYDEELQKHSLPICRYRANTTPLIAAYLRLVVLSVAFGASYRSGLSKECQILVKSLEVAQDVINIMVRVLAPTSFLRYAMPANFLYVTFAAAFLINLLRPKLSPLIDDRQRETIIQTVTPLIKVLCSDQVALDEKHTPMLYARFLTSLLTKYAPQALETREVALDNHVFSSTWPDVASNQDGGSQIKEQFNPEGLSAELAHSRHISYNGVVYQGHGEADMDLTLKHLVDSMPSVSGYPGYGFNSTLIGAQTFDFDFSQPAFLAQNTYQFSYDSFSDSDQSNSLSFSGCSL
ncbi:hypothetical protein FA15DRAFT_663164 [Coprinopsis marcescibilis]|uniref:Xylanolytic transcriptional activator regulatory domain-containing protein n=1 Tax=Coprinopsis marcescibilis TaxID=230819 RepID=A0A5C3LD78_COPMA|nr:hypothetical protein FA15DRAFT_663164 [Coprinopsis marcescibilis]